MLLRFMATDVRTWPRPLARACFPEAVGLVEAGRVNLARHIQITGLRVNVVVVINKFSTNTEAEMNVVEECSYCS